MTEAERLARWYLAHRDEHRARARVRYAAHRAELVADKRAYRKTAAGMLTDVRSHAKGRKS